MSITMRYSRERATDISCFGDDAEAFPRAGCWLLDVLAFLLPSILAFWLTADSGLLTAALI